MSSMENISLSDGGDPMKSEYKTVESMVSIEQSCYLDFLIRMRDFYGLYIDELIFS